MTDLDPTMLARAQEAREAAETERAANPPKAETLEEYYYRVRTVPGVFGDTNLRPSPPEVVVEEIPADAPVEVSLEAEVAPEAPAVEPPKRGRPKKEASTEE